MFHCSHVALSFRAFIISFRSLIMPLRGLTVAATFFSISCLFPYCAFAQSFSKLESLQKVGAKVSMLVVDLDTQKVIAKSFPSQRLSPASVSKLVIGANALESFGPNKTFTSQILKRGIVKNHTLYGDLVFYGGGDPSLTNEKIWFLTSDVARYGINKVTGKIIVNKSLFGNIDADDNRAHGQTHSRNAYDAPLSSAAVNFSVLAVVISPAQKSGEKANVALEPYTLSRIKIINNVKTIPAGVTQISVERNSTNSTDTFTVSGSISLHSPMVRVYRSISNPDQYAGEVIKAFLNSAGVETPGTIEVENKPLLATDTQISSVDSFPLAWQLRGLFEMSNNFIADMLTLHLGLQNNIYPDKHFLENSSKQLETFMNTISKSKSDVPLTLHSGSGLTPENRLSAEDVVSLLAKIYSHTNIFPDFLSALAAPNANGSLKNRFTHDQLAKHQFLSETSMMLRAKTGTLTEPSNVVALAGYSRLSNGHWIAFAYIVNASPQKAILSIENLRAAVDSNLLQILAAG